jgi:hypothetical protein
MQLVNKVGVDRQIANERVVLGEGKGFLFTLFAEQTAKIFKAIGSGFERLEQALSMALAECCLLRAHKPMMERSAWAPRSSKEPCAH